MLSFTAYAAMFGGVVMASGWANDNAVNDQIADSVADEVARARARLPKGAGLERCEVCDDPIPQARREALPGVRLCRACQEEQDAQDTVLSPYNRKGSKDSQLR